MLELQYAHKTYPAVFAESIYLYFFKNFLT